MNGAHAWLLAVPLTALLTTPQASADGIPVSYFTNAREEVLQQAPMSNGAVAVPWFERVQVRAAHDDSTQHQRSLAARLNLKTPGQYSAEKQLLELRANRSAASYRAALSETLKERYDLLIELNHQQRQLHLTAQQQHLSEKAVSAMRALAGSDEFSPRSLQSEQLRLAAFKEQHQLAAQRLRQTRQRFAGLLSAAHTGAATSRGDVDLSTLLPVDQLAALPQIGYEEGNEPHSVALDLALLDANIARKQLQREQDSGGFGLRFLELRHDRERGNSGGDYRLTVGIDLPTGRTFAASERQMQYNDAEHQMHQLHRRQARERAQAVEELELLVAEYGLYRRQLDDIEARLARHNQSTLVSLILDLKQEQLTSRSRLIRLEADIYRRYVDALNLRGLLGSEPLRNWLAIGQPVL